MRYVGVWAACGIALGLTGCGTLVNALVYHPDPVLARSPGEIGLPYEEVVFTADDGVRLHGWFVPAPGAAATVLWFHGNGGNVTDLLDKARLFHDRLGVHSFLFDYRGYGRSEGSPSEEGLYRDGRAALAAVLAHPAVRGGRVVLFGHSLGGAVAVELAIQERPLGLVLEAPFASLRAMRQWIFPFLPVDWIVGNQFDSLGRIGRLRAPLLILHGERDELVPIDQGRALFEAAGDPKTFVAFPEAAHNDIAWAGGARYVEAWIRFLESLGVPTARPAHR